MKKTNKVYTLLVLVLFVLAFFRVGLTIYTEKEKFFSKGYNANYQQYKTAYYSSQYVNRNPSIIPDETLEIFAAGAFLRGMNPILIVHDHPPLARYLVGTSLLLFDNPHLIMIPLLSASLIGLLLISYTICKNIFLSLIPVAIFANEPLFLTKLVNTPLLEPIQFPFIVFSFYFFIKGVTEKNYIRYFILTAIMLGFVISTRFFITGTAIVGCMVLYFLINKQINRRFFIFIGTLPIAVGILLLTYTKTMMDGYSVIKIFGIQKYMLLYHKSKFILPFTYWDLLLFNKWHTWWGNREIISDPKWMITWPVAMALTCINFLLWVSSEMKFQPGEKILMLWILIYSVMLSTGYTSTNYFLPVIPFLYIIATAGMIKISERSISYYKKLKKKYD